MNKTIKLEVELEVRTTSDTGVKKTVDEIANALRIRESNIVDGFVLTTNFRDCDNSEDFFLKDCKFKIKRRIVTLRFEDLYMENGAETKYGFYIDFYYDDSNDTEYYDLKTSNVDYRNSKLIGCDGENFEVILEDKENDMIVLKNNKGENPIEFKLSFDEFELCCYFDSEEM